MGERSDADRLYILTKRLAWLKRLRDKSVLMPNKNAEKGDSLEKAVSLIQEAILQADPSLKGIKFSIERKRIVSIAGTRHEIDVWVETHPVSRFKSIFIFECKNWQKPVGKNDVIIFSEKIKVVGANRGFLVAHRFTKDAVAQAKSDSRLEILECTGEFAK